METPFLTYLTVFKSRIGAINLTLPITGFAPQPHITLSKKLKNLIEKKVFLRLSDENNHHVFNYLLEKKIISANKRASGRYKGYKLKKSEDQWIAVDERGKPISELPVFQIDIWMSSNDLSSTIGTPTSDNSEEVLDFCYQIGVLSKSKNTWTAAGQLISNLRSNYEMVIADAENPFVLGLEMVAFLRQLIEKDGLMLREILREITFIDKEINRTDITNKLVEITERVNLAAAKLNLKPQVLKEGKNFQKLIENSKLKRANKNNSNITSGSVGPGVLEHRTSPRLEWLTDFGVLSKIGIQKNSFQYKKTKDTLRMLNFLDEEFGNKYWAEEVALRFWRDSTYLQLKRNRLPKLNLQEAICSGYKIMQRTIGPTSIREVCFAAGILSKSSSLFVDIINELIQWATNEKAITLSGGRYNRSPELVHITPHYLKNFWFHE